MFPRSGRTRAIELALALHADLALIDERKGTHAALTKGLETTGTLGILQPAAFRGLIDLASAFSALRRTNFRYRQEVLDRLLDEISRR